MSNNLFSTKRLWIGTVMVCVLIVGGSYLYNWHVRRTTDAEFPRLDAVDVDDQHPAQDTGGTSPVDFGDAAPGLDAEDTSSVSTDTAEHSPSETAAETSDSAVTRETDTGAADEPAEGVEVSPYGFGPYPEVPPDFPSNLSWNDPNRHANLPDHALKNIELLERVLIKLWTEGDKGFRGGSTYNGKVYPHYHNTIYVRYAETTLPDGTIRRYPTRIKSGPHVDYNAHDFLSDNPPDHLRILELDSTGIDPYQYLNLP